MKEKALVRLERKIVIGMIVDTDFLEYADQILDTKWVQSNDARTIMTWILDYFHEFEKAPGLHIQEIYEDKLDNGKVQEAQAEVIELILEDLSNEVENWDPDDVGFLKKQALKYANVCKLKEMNETVEDLIDSGEVNEAQITAKEYDPIEVNESKAVQPLHTDEQLDAVFAERQKPLIKFNGAVGQLLNPHMIRQGFVVFLAQNKGGKSFYLMDSALKAAGQGQKVLIAQAGDMSQIQMERRIAIYNTQISDQERYCGVLYIPIVDCAHNQMGTCEMGNRIDPDQEGPFEDEATNFLKEKVNYSFLREAFEINKSYKPCQECRRKMATIQNFKGAIWYTKRGKVEPLTKSGYLAKRKEGLKKFYSPFHAMKNIRISTHSNESLNMNILENEVKLLYEREGFKADIIVADYLDLFGPDRDTAHLSFRDQENKKWQRGRRISQDWDLLFMSGSQSDAQGFNKLLLDRSNFSEDRRKLDHVTAMIGLNMSIIEKQMGVLRMNEVVSRETEGTSVAHVLHRLQMGRPILGSYF